MSFIFYENFRSHKISAVFWFFFKDRIYRSSYWHISKVCSKMVRKHSIKNFDKVYETTQLSVIEHILNKKLGILGKGEGVRVRLFTTHRIFFFDVTNDIHCTFRLLISWRNFARDLNWLRSFRECTVCFLFLHKHQCVLKMQRQIFPSEDMGLAKHSWP